MDSGLQSLITIVRFHQLPAESEQLTRQLAQLGEPFSDTLLMSAAKANTTGIFLMHDLREATPQSISQVELEALWSG